MSRFRVGLAVAGSMLVPASLYAASVALPHTFSAGSPIRASEVNANFTRLRSALEALPEGARSGTRLRRVHVAGSEGARAEWPQFYDAVLGLYCWPHAVDATGSARCLPELQDSGPHSEVYADAGCTTPLFTWRSRALPGLPAETRRMLGFWSNGEARIRELGSVHSGPRYALQFSSEGSECVRIDTPDPATYYLLGADVAPGAFEPMHFELL